MNSLALKMINMKNFILVFASILVLAGCSSMNKQQKGTANGTAVLPGQYRAQVPKLHTKTYLLRRRRQSDDPETVVPSDFEIATFILVAATVDPYIPTVRPRATKKHKGQQSVKPAAINRSRFDYI
jgi:5-enolpyruvylshikimate-3-phosphate synthase